MVERIQDLTLPNSVVARLIKEVIPARYQVSKEIRVAIARAASVFVIYLSAACTAEAKKAKVKTITSDHVCKALEEIEFESFLPAIKDALETYRQGVKDKKDRKKEANAADKSKDSSNAAEDETNNDDAAGGED